MSTAPNAPVFDPERYKSTTRDQWDAAAQAWHNWAPTLRQWLGPSTELMLDMAGVKPGSVVLDVAAGAGDQTLNAAERVGAEGMVLATDISSRILEFAQNNAASMGYRNVRTKVLDGENLDVPPGSFDAVISRVGLIYFPDQQKALLGMRRALKPGGRVGAIVYSTADRNQFFSVPVSIIRRRANLPAPAPGQPGPFSLGGDGVLRDALLQAGFTDIAERRMPAPLKMKSAAECLRFEKESFGALHTMLAGLDEAGKEAAWREIEGELRKFEGTAGFEGPCEMIVIAGRA
ncbi:MAG TPA: class I SAM-dependent methyltransferase [archaeon]|nr:class I SAM-dependent methyltransferase [archaeon]